jgi:hypothetical protein
MKSQMEFHTGIGYISQSVEPSYFTEGSEVATFRAKVIWSCHSKGLCGKFHLACTAPTDPQLREKAKKLGITKFRYKKIRVS